MVKQIRSTVSRRSLLEITMSVTNTVITKRFPNLFDLRNIFGGVLTDMVWD